MIVLIVQYADKSAITDVLIFPSGEQGQEIADLVANSYSRLGQVCSIWRVSNPEYLRVAIEELEDE